MSVCHNIMPCLRFYSCNFANELQKNRIEHAKNVIGHAKNAILRHADRQLT